MTASGYWRQRPVAVTGGAGFIGRALVARLCALGADVRVIARYTSLGEGGVRTRLDPEIRERVSVVLLDVADGRAVRSALEGCDVVFHLAALIGIPYSYVAPASYVATNVLGTMAVLEAARDLRVQRVVHTSTSEVYGTAQQVPITESHPLHAQSPYAASKIAADQLAGSYFHSFEVPVVTVRPFNAYGPGQSERAVVPTILAQLLARVSELHLGSLGPRRDMTYVDDTVNGFVLAGEVKGIEGEVVQLGTGTAVSVGELAELCMEITGHCVEIRTDPERVRPSTSEVELLLSEPSKAATMLGWHPVVRLREGLERTAAWMTGRGGSDARRFVR